MPAIKYKELLEYIIIVKKCIQQKYFNLIIVINIYHHYIFCFKILKKINNVYYGLLIESKTLESNICFFNY